MNLEVIAHEVKSHGTKIEEHDKRLDELEKGKAATDVKIDNLCERLEEVTRSLNWLIGLLATGLVGFFFFAIQKQLFN